MLRQSGTPHQEYLCDMLENIQKRSARRILHDFRRTTSSTALVQQLNLQPLRERRKIDKVSGLYKVLNGLVDIKPPPEVKLTPSTTRGASEKIKYPKSGKNAGLYSFYPSATRLWRELPPQALAAATLPAFRSALQDWAVGR